MRRNERSGPGIATSPAGIVISKGETEEDAPDAGPPVTGELPDPKLRVSPAEQTPGRSETTSKSVNKRRRDCIWPELLLRGSTTSARQDKPHVGKFKGGCWSFSDRRLQRARKHQRGRRQAMAGENL